MASQTITEDHIRTAAYYIWLQEGQPQGMDEEHWIRARTQLESGVSTKAKPARLAPRPKAATPAAKGAGAATSARRGRSAKAKA